MSIPLPVKLTVLCSGANTEGKSFEERTRTTMIEKAGGRLITRQKLAAGSEMDMCLLARPDRSVRVSLGEVVNNGAEGAEWTFSFVSAATEFWGVRFPGEVVPLPGESPVEPQAAALALAQMTDQLLLISAHADDHLRYCTQELELLRERFTREVQSALDSGVRQLREVARSTMETTFRSLLEDLAQRAAGAVDDSLARLRKTADDSVARHDKAIDAQAEARMDDFRDQLEKHSKKVGGQLAEFKAEADRAIRDAIEQALADFQAGCAALLKDLAHSTESRKPTKALAVRRKS